MAGLRLASWNVESIRAHEAQVLGWVDRVEPDLVCLQETRADQRKFPRRPWTDRGYELVIHGGNGGRGGVAIASKAPLDNITLGIPGAVPPLDEPLSIAVTVDGLRVHTCYAPNGRKVATPAHQVKLAWFALYAAWLEMDREDDPDQILLGDLNIAPTDIDVWDASRYRKRNLTSPPERDAFDALLGDGALVDVVRSRAGDDRVYTWWNRRSDFYETDRGWRLDHVLATPSVDARITSATIDRAERGHRRHPEESNSPSGADHAPLVVDLA